VFEEEDRWCPECHRVGRRLGDHDCHEPLTAVEARESIAAQGGVLGHMDLRADRADVSRTFDGALQRLAETMDDTAAALRVSKEAMRSLERALADHVFKPGTDERRAVGSYQGIPIIEDDRLPPGEFFALSKREWEPVQEFGSERPVDFIRRESYHEAMRAIGSPQSFTALRNLSA
jgi:hypothetical protein